MRKCCLLVVIPLFIVACGGKKLPKGILSKEKMGAVIWDLTRATEFLDGYVLNKDSTIDKGGEGSLLYANVLRMHQLSKAEFDKSYVYYKTHPDLIKEVLDSLNKRQFRAPDRPGQLPTPKDSTALADSQRKAHAIIPPIKIADSLIKSKKLILRRR